MIKGLKGNLLIKPNCNTDDPYPRDTHHDTIRIIAELLMEAGVSIDDPKVLDYIAFLEEYACAIYEHDARMQDEKTPIDWKRVAYHTTGGVVTGGLMGGLVGAMLVGSALGGGVLVEEKTEKKKTDLRAMYIGGGLGAIFGLMMGSPMIMALCMYTGLVTAGFHQGDAAEQLTERVERHKLSIDEGFRRRVAELKRNYANRVRGYIEDLRSL